MEQIDWRWFHSKILIFGRVMAKQLCACPYLSIRISAITPPFLGHLDWIFYGSSGDHFLSIGDEKSMLRCLFFSFDFKATFGGNMGVVTKRTPNGLGPPNPTKKLVHLADLLGQPLSRNHVFEIFKGEPPPLKIAFYQHLNC